MNKLSIAQLETARKNPKEFAANLNNAKTTSAFGGQPKSMRWLSAVCEFHNNNINSAATALEKSFSNRRDTLKNRNEVSDLVDALSNYSSEYTGRKFTFIESRKKIDSEINSKLKLSGIIPLILMKPLKGFSAYFILNSPSPSWKDELKFPIVQNYVGSKLFACEISDVDVGVIDYQTGEFLEISYSKSEIEEAESELQKIGKTISQILK
jgi:hypothetical protein